MQNAPIFLTSCTIINELYKKELHQQRLENTDNQMTQIHANFFFLFGVIDTTYRSTYEIFYEKKLSVENYAKASPTFLHFSQTTHCRKKTQ